VTSLHRVLVVEDHEPIRRVICGLLQQRADVLVVGEAADGGEAVRQAEALRPDVVVLDIGLPVLSGMEAAGRIRAVVPDARLLFVTNEPSLEVVEQAFTRGARGYVYKPRVQQDVLPVFDAIVRGGRFVSGGLERIARGDGLASHRHQLLFCSSEAVLVRAFSRFTAGVLHEGNVVIVLVTEAHGQSLQRSLQNSHVDFAHSPRKGCEQSRRDRVRLSSGKLRISGAIGAEIASIGAAISTTKGTTLRQWNPNRYLCSPKRGVERECDRGGIRRSRRVPGPPQRWQGSRAATRPDRRAYEAPRGGT
jgi:DNA-binding NarL/FixJ family response regulator